MKVRLTMVLLAFVLAGCSGGSSPSSPSSAGTSAQTTPGVSGTPAAAVAYAYPQDSIKKGDTALCVLCVVDEGTKEPEKVAETINYEGKTYAFCNLDEKAKFISSPAKYASK